MSNPLLQANGLPPFSTIKAEHIEPALDALLAENCRRIDNLLDDENIAGPAFLQFLEDWGDELNKLWAPVSHLNGVKNSESLRDAYNACLPKLTEYTTEIGQNDRLYQRYRAIADGDEYEQLSPARRKAVDNALRDFKLSGVALPTAQKKRYAEIQQRLAELSNRFSNNVLDATQGWFLHLDDGSRLAGVPEIALQGYRQAAEARSLSGYVLSLDVPAFLPIMQYAADEALRREMYFAYNTRASDQGPNAGQWDNSSPMEEILALRHELARLLGFNNYAECSLATKMAENPNQVLEFLYDLAAKSRPAAENDYEVLREFAQSLGHKALNAWDVPYFSEKLRLQKYALSQEALRPYFPVDTVISGMFAIVERLFGIAIEAATGVDAWHPDVRFFEIRHGDEVVACFYLDLFAREQKRGGAWMADCRVRRRLRDGSIQLPIAFLTCNFTPPTRESPSLLTHSEVTTLFHEFGHGLHHMLTQIDCADVSGINGVAWDAVELPSQFLENWCWEPQAIPMISGHYQTGEPLPAEMLEKMLAAKNFQSGLFMVRQLEFALFDFRLHAEYNPQSPRDIQNLLDEVRDQVAVIPVPESNRFQHSFTHIFAGGYAAGYYSYKWAELLSADAFSRFEEEGVFNAETGRSFLQEILQQGGAREPMELFVSFRGREPVVDALLRHNGLTSQGETA